MAFRARFPGRSTCCDEGIEVDDLVRYEDGQTGLVHVDCDTLERQPEKPAAVCDRCWLTKPCGCDDGSGA